MADSFERAAKPYSIPQVIFASSVGTMIEWYDFYLFGSLAAVLAPKIYPAGNDTFALIAYLATFAVGFVVPGRLERCSSGGWATWWGASMRSWSRW